jgi:hypothetical protein
MCPAVVLNGQIGLRGPYDLRVPGNAAGSSIRPSSEARNEQ